MTLTREFVNTVSTELSKQFHIHFQFQFTFLGEKREPAVRFTPAGSANAESIVLTVPLMKELVKQQ